MAPIRVGLVGLNSVPSVIPEGVGGQWAASAHLPYLIQSPYYKITALLNSSVASAQAAIKRHNLPSDTKTYGTPEDLAQDPDVDLVVCCVRVDRHHQVTMPSIRAGKSIYVEWPLGSNRAQAEEMLAAAKKSGSKTIVGLQGRVSPFTQKVKQLVDSKAIGDLLSARLTNETGYPGESEPPGIDYMVTKESGGNMHSVIFGHPADTVIYALGGIEEFSAVLSTRWPNSKLLHPDGSFDKPVKRETPDHVMLQGSLAKSGAPITIFVRNGKTFKDTPAFEWRIFGTKGEIRVTAFATIGLGVGGEKLELFDHEKDTVEVVDVQYGDAVKSMPMFANNVGGLYELFAKGGSVDEGFVDFEQALEFHKLIEKMEKSWEGKRYEKTSV